MWNAPADTVQIEVPHRLFWAMHWRPLNLLVAAFTGVSVSFCPLFLYQLGFARVPLWDWRVLTNVAVIFLVPGVYINFEAPVLARAWKRRTDSASGADDADRRPGAKVVLLFWLLKMVCQWSKDASTIYTYRQGVPLEVYAIDVKSGLRRLWRSFAPPEAGFATMSFVMTRDARSYAYGYTRPHQELYVAEGLK